MCKVQKTEISKDLIAVSLIDVMPQFDVFDVIHSKMTNEVNF